MKRVITLAILTILSMQVLHGQTLGFSYGNNREFQNVVRPLTVEPVDILPRVNMFWFWFDYPLGKKQSIQAHWHQLNYFGAVGYRSAADFGQLGVGGVKGITRFHRVGLRYSRELVSVIDDRLGLSVFAQVDYAIAMDQISPGLKFASFEDAPDYDYYAAVYEESIGGKYLLPSVGFALKYQLTSWLELRSDIFYTQGHTVHSRIVYEYEYQGVEDVAEFTANSTAVTYSLGLGIKLWNRKKKQAALD